MNSVIVFFRLLCAGLWHDVKVNGYGLKNNDLPIAIDCNVDWSEVNRLATEQAVVGLIAAGLESVEKNKVVKQEVLRLIGQTLQIEDRNKAMNDFIAELISRMRKQDIYALLIKGQGIAQCYERPLWRSCGDVDLFLSDDNYDKAKEFLKPIASFVEEEHIREKHLGMTIGPWVVELHGRLYCGLSSRIEQVLDEVQQDTFRSGTVRSWDNNGVQILQLDVENDAFYVFTHILQHFYKGGIGLRQVCDWCRLLWTYRESLNHELLESRIHKAGLMSEWKAFGAFAVECLGMPKETMPFYSSDKKWKRKADRICSFIIEVGNFGHNRDSSYFSNYPYVIRKCVSMGRRIGDLVRHARIFPLDSFKFFPRIMFNGIRSAVRGE